MALTCSRYSLEKIKQHKTGFTTDTISLLDRVVITVKAKRAVYKHNYFTSA